MIYYKDYPGFTYGSQDPASLFQVWDSNFSEDFVYVILGKITSYSTKCGDSKIYETFEEAMQAIKCNAIMEYFDDEY